MSQPSVRVTQMTDDEKRHRVRLLLGYMIVDIDPERRSAEPLARKMGFSRQFINLCIQRGKCSPDLAKRLQREFGKEKAPADQLCWSKQY